MPSTDIDGTPILILRLEDVKVVEEAMAIAANAMIKKQAYLQYEEQFNGVYKKLEDFLDEAES